MAMRIISVITFLWLFSQVSAQDTCTCNELRNMNGGQGMWDFYVKDYSKEGFSGICFEGTKDMKAGWKKYKDGYVYEYRSGVYNGIAHYTYKEIRKDTLISVAEEYNQHNNQLERKWYVYEKNEKRYRLEYHYAMDGKLMEVEQHRYIRANEGEAVNKPAHVFNKDGYYYAPVQEGPYLFYGGRYGIANTTFPQISGQYLNGEKNGYWFENYETGKMKNSGWYLKDKKDSLWTEYYYDGQLKSLGKYKYNIRDGEWKEWDNEGHITLTGKYDANQFSSDVTEYHSNGQIKSHYTAIAGRFTGKKESWYDNGVKESEIPYVDGIADGLAVSWYSNRQAMSRVYYQNGSPEGLFDQWFENGRLSVSKKYINHQLTDTFRIWNVNGFMTQEFIYRNGLQEGKQLTWYEDGKAKTKADYSAGKKNRMYWEWNEAGVLVHEIEYKGNLPNGIYKTWSANGVLVQEYNYTNHIRNGRCRRWNENGQLTFDRTYEMGKPVGYKSPEKIMYSANCQVNATKPFNSCKNFHDAYRSTVLLLAGQMASLDSASPYFNQITVPVPLQHFIETNLVVLYNSGVNVFTDYSAGDTAMYHSVYLYNVPNELLEHWIKGELKTGNKQMDSISAVLGLKLIPNSVQGRQVLFTSKFPVNHPALTRLLKRIDPQMSSYSGYGRVGDGNHVYMKSIGAVTEVTFSIGYGDCPSGCIGRYNTVYYVYPDGEVELMSAPEEMHDKQLMIQMSED
jgi:antitoxin component YwqK of YwqJK toxin-antitoxin module